MTPVRPVSAAPRRMILGAGASLLARPALLLPAFAPAALAQPVPAQADPRAAPGMSRTAARGPAQDDFLFRWMVVADRLASDPQTTQWPRAHTIAMVAIAIHDALNAIEPRYRRWAPRGRGEPRAAGASPLAAMSMAAFSVLARRHIASTRSAEAEALLQEALARVPSASGRSAGVALGSAIGTATLDRAGPSPEKRAFPVSDAEGRWRPTPPLPLLGITYVDQPMLFPDNASLRGPPPPDITSARFRAEVEEVRRMGGAGETGRSAAQTEAASFWVPQSLQRNLHRFLLLRLASQPPAGGLWEEARMNAVLAVAFADNDVLLFAEKLHYLFWRPVTVINAGCPGLRPDPSWTTLLPTPPHPEYPSGHSADFATGAAVLTGLLGEGPVAYQAVDRAGQPIREFPSLAAASEECSESRIWAGAHFRSALVEGQRIGRAVAARALQQVPALR